MLCVIFTVTKAVGAKLEEIVEMINNADDSTDESDDDVDQDFEVKRRTSSSKAKQTAESSGSKTSNATRGNCHFR